MNVKIIEVDPSIAELVKQNDGYCPCMIGHEPETRCMCEMFRQQTLGKCLCGRFEKVLVEDEE